MTCCPQITVLLPLSGVSVCCQRNKTPPSLDIAFEIQYLKRIAFFMIFISTCDGIEFMSHTIH